MSEKAPLVYEAILGVMEELGHAGIGKDRRNKDQGFNFRGIEDVLNALTPLLVKHKLVILPRYKTHESVVRQSQKGGYLNDVFMSAEFDFVSAVDGSRHTVTTYGQGMDSADKATNKAMSGAFKYAAFFAFCVPTEGVIDEGDFETPTPKAPGPKKEQAEPAKPAAKSEAKIVLSEIPEGEEEQEITWRVENVWPILLGDVQNAQSAGVLKAAFARAYKWAKALPMPAVSKNLLAGVTHEYEGKKKELNIE